MTYQVAIGHSDIAFPAESGETVLDAAERAGYAMPYSCRKGVCSTCEGSVTAGTCEVRGRGTIEAPAPGVLLCQTRPVSSVEIAPQPIVTSEPPARRTVEAKVH